MSQGPLPTFHPFPRLPLELRIQVWESASVHGRVVKVRNAQHLPLFHRYLSSPTPVPGVTRVSHESRKLCSYQRYFRDEVTQRYIWVNFANDVLHMDSVLMYWLATQDSAVVEKNAVRHLRIDLAANFDPRFDLSRRLAPHPGPAASSKLRRRRA
jgi:hypothetical protein